MASSPLESALGSPPPVRRFSSPAAVVEEILETARQRSISFQTGELPMSISPHRRPPPPPLHERDGGTAAASDGPDSSADEQTAIMRSRARPRTDYQSTAAAPTRSAQLDGKRAVGRRAERPSREEPPDNAESWWRRQVEKYGAIELDNKGSVARDHLALERTFLAWLRTSLAFASIGVAITQLFRLSTSLTGPSDGGDPYLRLRQLGKPLGATFLGISILILFIGFYRYFETQHWIIRGKFPVSRGSVALVAVVAFALMMTSLVVVLVAEPSSFDKTSL